MDEDNWYGTISFPWNTFPLSKHISPIHYLYREYKSGETRSGERTFHVVGFMQYGTLAAEKPFVILEWYSNLTQCWTLFNEMGSPTVVIRNYDDIVTHRNDRYTLEQARGMWKGFVSNDYLPMGETGDPAAKITFEKAGKEIAMSIWEHWRELKEMDGEDDIYGSGSPAEFMAKLEERKRSKYGKDYKEKIRDRENLG